MGAIAQDFHPLGESHHDSVQHAQPDQVWRVCGSIRTLGERLKRITTCRGLKRFSHNRPIVYCARLSALHLQMACVYRFTVEVEISTHDSIAFNSNPNWMQGSSEWLFFSELVML